MTAALSPYQQGLITPLAVVGGILVAGGLIWLVLILLPEITWWTVRRLPLDDQHGRDRAASVVAASRRAYILRIPYGVRLIVPLGGDLDSQDATLAALTKGRQVVAGRTETSR